MDKETTLHELKEKLRIYNEARDYGQFHNAKDMAAALIIEAGELLEHFRFKDIKEVENLFEDEKKREKIEDELADVAFWLFRFSQIYDIDITKAFNRKMKKNEAKYPIDKFKGSNKKYNED